jgi:transaldolase
MASLLEQLKQYTVVVADTGDFESIQQFRPRDATTNPSLIEKAAQMPAYQEVVTDALRKAVKEVGSNQGEPVLRHALDRLAVDFGLKILEIIPGRVSTEVDARLSYDTDGTIKKAHEIIELYHKAGIDNSRVLIKIASTWEGIKAAEVLEKEGIHCNLTLLFGMHQAVACAEAKVTLISPFVGRILDWYKKSTGKASYPAHEDPGVVSVTQIYNYYKKYDYKTEVMGASFRNLGEITELAGCDLLTISPQLLTELEKGTGDLPRKLSPEFAAERGGERIAMDQAAFQAMHEKDTMAKEKLAEGIAGFTKSIEVVETLIAERLAKL